LVNAGIPMMGQAASHGATPLGGVHPDGYPVAV
jgi:hypothetical protein